MCPLFNNGQGISYTCRSICDAMQAQAFPVQAWFPASDTGAGSPIIRNGCPKILLPLVYRLPDASRRLARNAERAFLRALRPGDISYLWPGVTLDTYRRIKDRGITILSERVNCHTQFAKRLLDQEYDRIGWPVSHDITEEGIQTELNEMELSDFIFAPNRFVVRSLIESGVPRGKILPVSYGWDPTRINSAPRPHRDQDGFTIIFVGRLCIRKGVHLLLQAWEKADIKGRLLLAGAAHFDVAQRLTAQLARPDVVHLGHTLDIGAVYRSADAFVFGSLEEGGPLVTYEAMGSGLPVVASPMGAGAARHEMDGFIVEPHDIDGWVAALRRLANDADLCREMGRSAAERAQEYTWNKVAARRLELLHAAMNPATEEAAA